MPVEKNKPNGPLVKILQWIVVAKIFLLFYIVLFFSRTNNVHQHPLLSM